MLQVSGLAYSYGSTAVLDGVDLSVAGGEVVSLVGPNGAGKSTLLKCLNGILTPASGTVLLASRPSSSYGRRELARTIAYVPQHAGLVASLTVADVVALGRAPHRGQTTRHHDREVVMSVIRTLHLERVAFRLFNELSGGERQRVLIARALAQDGRLMLFDEPTNALDLRHQLDTMTIIRSLAMERGISVLLAIHDLGLASRFSDRLIMLSRGSVHAAGAWSEVLTSRNLEQVYGVSAIIGSEAAMPYVIPTRTVTPRDGDLTAR